MVATARIELGAAVILVWLAGMFDAGSYLVGAGARRRLTGLVAGITGAVAVIYMAVQLAVPPLEPDTAWQYGVLAAVTLPLGPALAAALLSDRGWAVRRLDSLMVTGPLWAWSIDRLVG